MGKKKPEPVVRIEDGMIHIRAHEDTSVLEIEAAFALEIYKFHKRDLSAAARSAGLRVTTLKALLRWARILRSERRRSSERMAG